MHERREGRASVGGPVLLIIAVLLSSAVCRRETGRETQAGDPVPAAALSVPAPPPVDRALDDCFAFAGGLPVESPSYAAWLEDASWKEFAALTGKAWEEFDSAVLQPMKAWAREDLWEINEYPAALFYPFGGPDFATAFALFPGATKTILMGLEPVGNLPDFERTTAEWRGEFFADLGTLVSGFLKRGYFITMDMMDVYTRGKVEGALPVIGFFLKRGGYSVVDVRRLVPDGSGGWIETPYEQLAKRPRRPYGVKIDYLGPGDTAPRSVYYFSCDLENKAFAEESALHRFFEGLGTMTTFVKSGSYLLHWGNFSTVRKLILERSLFVLQDDTAIPYRFFKSRDWDIRLFGRYATPVKDFTNVEQLDLRAAYEDPDVSVKPLSFHFGYRWVTQVDNLLLAKRPRRPYKVPVIK
ncbi:MAG: hypothetical protein IH583_04545 [Candidatus Aminicenantes bacterium]|nr:hypothetical protein [Candidatus Aminicenantes bacterium]